MADGGAEYPAPRCAICREIIGPDDERHGAGPSRVHRRCLRSTLVNSLENLAQKIIARLDAGVLPRDDPAKTEMLYGSGMACDGCDNVILQAQTEYRLHSTDGQTPRLHLGCYGLWDAARG